MTSIVTCSDEDLQAVYGLSRSSLHWLLSPTVASKIDPNWISNMTATQCAGKYQKDAATSMFMEGMIVRCLEDGEQYPVPYYRVTNGVIQLLESPVAAASWDPNWTRNRRTVVCGGLQRSTTPLGATPTAAPYVPLVSGAAANMSQSAALAPNATPTAPVTQAAPEAGSLGATILSNMASPGILLTQMSQALAGLRAQVAGAPPLTPAPGASAAVPGAAPIATPATMSGSKDTAISPVWLYGGIAVVVIIVIVILIWFFY